MPPNARHAAQLLTERRCPAAYLPMPTFVRNVDLLRRERAAGAVPVLDHCAASLVVHGGVLFGLVFFLVTPAYALAGLAPTADARAAARKSPTGSGGPRRTSECSISVKSKSIRLIFGRIECSRDVLEARRRSSRRSCRTSSH